MPNWNLVEYLQSRRRFFGHPPSHFFQKKLAEDLRGVNLSNFCTFEACIIAVHGKIWRTLVH